MTIEENELSAYPELEAHNYPKLNSHYSFHDDGVKQHFAVFEIAIRLKKLPQLDLLLKEAEHIADNLEHEITRALRWALKHHDTNLTLKIKRLQTLNRAKHTAAVAGSSGSQIKTDVIKGNYQGFHNLLQMRTILNDVANSGVEYFILACQHGHANIALDLYALNSVSQRINLACLQKILNRYTSNSIITNVIPVVLENDAKLKQSATDALVNLNNNTSDFMYLLYWCLEGSQAFSILQNLALVSQQRLISPLLLSVFGTPHLAARIAGNLLPGHTKPLHDKAYKHFWRRNVSRKTLAPAAQRYQQNRFHGIVAKKSDSRSIAMEVCITHAIAHNELTRQPRGLPF